MTKRIRSKEEVSLVRTIWNAATHPAVALGLMAFVGVVGAGYGLVLSFGGGDSTNAADDDVPGLAVVTKLVFVAAVVVTLTHSSQRWIMKTVRSWMSSGGHVSHSSSQATTSVSRRRRLLWRRNTSTDVRPLIRRRINAAKTAEASTKTFKVSLIATRELFDSALSSGTSAERQPDENTMAGGGRRNANKGFLKPPIPPDDSRSRSTNDDSSKSTIIMGPKHISVPELPVDGELMFETIMLLYSYLTLFLQYLHLYRTVWWLPHSYTKYAMNFHLVDLHLVGFILVVLSRRFVWCVCRRLVACFCPTVAQQIALQLIKGSLIVAVISLLGWCSLHIMKLHPIVNIFYLYYPIFIYILRFGPSITSFFDLIPEPVPFKEPTRSGCPPLTHLCSGTPEIIREEVQTLKNDFNNRIKQVLFNSLISAYYAGFVPCCFAQNSLYYNKYFAAQHLFFTFVGGFIMYIVHCYPPRYCDLLHQSALHLGKWVKLEGRHVQLPYSSWSDASFWHQGALVKHLREVYRAEGVANAAEPGNSSHARFYWVFQNPANLLCGLLGLQLIIVVLQVILLIRSSEWYQLISLSLVLFTNYYTLFKLARDYFVLGKVYRAEQLIQNKTVGTGGSPHMAS